jgi:N-methylhydantoinase A
MSAGIYDRAKLAPGDVIAGPAVIEQFDATTLILAGQTATVDRYGLLIMESAT